MTASPRTAAIDLVVIQPTPFCNLDCDYCYLPARDSRQKISFAVLRAAFERVLSSRYSTKPFTVVWHAGEPLVLPSEFYAEAFTLLAELNRKHLAVRHSFQTNGTLLDDDWCEFIARHDVKLGVSLDGPRSLHDARRRTRSGRGTHAQVMAGIELLQAHEIPFHVITVLTLDALDHADEIFSFYLDHGIDHVCFNVEEIEGVNATSSLAVADVEEKFRKFMLRFSRRLREAKTPLRVREFEGVRKLVESGRWLERNQQNTPMRIVNIDCSGNISTFSPELLGMKAEPHGDFLIGNVLTDSLEACESSDTFRRVLEEIDAGVEACRDSCEYFAVCGGGSPSNKYFENGSFRSTETLHCRLTRQVMMDVGLDHVEATLGDRRIPRAGDGANHATLGRSR